MSTTLAERLKETREFLGFSQEALGAICGVTKLTQYNYEAGKRNPDSEYLAALAKFGVDVLYIITGQRITGMLGGEELALLNYYRAAPEAIKKAALGVLLSAQPQHKEPKEKAIKARGNVQIASASNVVQIGGKNSGDIKNESKVRKRK